MLFTVFLILATSSTFAIYFSDSKQTEAFCLRPFLHTEALKLNQYFPLAYTCLVSI